MLAHRLGAVAEPAAHVLLAAERLHHLDADDGLVGRLGHVSLSRLHLARERRHTACEAEREHSDRRHRDCGVEREPGVHDHEHDSGRDDHQQALDGLDQAPADEVPDRVEVVRRPRQHLPGRVAVVERPRVAHVRAVEQLAHARLDADADPRRRVAAREVDREAQGGETDDRDDVRPQRLRVLDDRVVDRLLREQRDRDRDQRVAERERDSEHAQAPLCSARAGAACGRSAAGRGRVGRRDSRIRA